MVESMTPVIKDMTR